VSISNPLTVFQPTNYSTNDAYDRRQYTQLTIPNMLKTTLKKTNKLIQVVNLIHKPLTLRLRPYQAKQLPNNQSLPEKTGANLEQLLQIAHQLFLPCAFPAFRSLSTNPRTAQSQSAHPQSAKPFKVSHIISINTTSWTRKKTPTSTMHNKPLANYASKTKSNDVELRQQKTDRQSSHKTTSPANYAHKHDNPLITTTLPH
jgi:hypothetical protein